VWTFTFEEPLDRKISALDDLPRAPLPAGKGATRTLLREGLENGKKFDAILMT